MTFFRFFKVVLVCFSFVLTCGVAWGVPIAAIEIGSTGVKGRVIDLDRTEGLGGAGLMYKVLFKEDINVGIIDGASGGLLPTEGIRRAVGAIKNLIGQMRSHDPVHLTVVGSTSFDSYTNRIALENAIAEETGLRVRFITQTDEIFFALRASVPRSWEQRAILIDVGSGNTKLGYHSVLAGSKKFESLRIEMGSAKLRDAALTRGGDFVQSAKAIIDQDVRPALRAQFNGHAALFNPRRSIFVEGGAAWASATFAQPAAINSQYTKLGILDFARARQSMQSTVTPVSSMPELAKVEQARILDEPRLGLLWALAGSMLIEAIIEEVRPANRDIFFNRNTGWIIGYAISDYEESIKK